VDDALVRLYLDAKQAVIAGGYVGDIDWAEGLDFEQMTESDFLSEGAWVIFNSGFRASTIRAKWGELQAAFRWFQSAQHIVGGARNCRKVALQAFGNKAKVDAVLELAAVVAEEGWPAIKAAIAKGGPEYLQRFRFIGKITCFHLARDLGLDCVKPDRHLARMAEAAGYATPLAMCTVIADFTGDRLGVVDMVLWRWATIEPDYAKKIDKEN
jgi:hypothetical protein